MINEYFVCLIYNLEDYFIFSRLKGNLDGFLGVYDPTTGQYSESSYTAVSILEYLDSFKLHGWDSIPCPKKASSFFNG